jgi:hypothetical protein
MKKMPKRYEMCWRKELLNVIETGLRCFLGWIEWVQSYQYGCRSGKALLNNIGVHDTTTALSKLWRNYLDHSSQNL